MDDRGAVGSVRRPDTRHRACQYLVAFCWQEHYITGTGYKSPCLGSPQYEQAGMGLSQNGSLLLAGATFQLESTIERILYLVSGSTLILAHDTKHTVTEFLPATSL